MKISIAGSQQFWMSNRLKVGMNLLDSCNFSCSYCINSSVKKKKRKLDPALAQLFINTLANLEREEIDLGIVGGEPTLYPYLKELLLSFDRKITCPQKRIGILTNGSRIATPFVQSLFENLCNTKLEFLVTVHFEQISFAELLKNILVSPFRQNIIVKLLLSPGRLEIAKGAAAHCQDHGLRLMVLPLYHSKTGEGFAYSTEEQKFLDNFNSAQEKQFFNVYEDENGCKSTRFFSKIDKVREKELVRYSGMLCAAGYASVRIDPEGNLTRCAGCLEPLALASASRQALEHFFSPAPCTSSLCTCPPYIAVPKWRTSQDAPFYLRCEG